MRAANPAPKAKRITGPKLLAAGNTGEYKPGTEDSNFDDSAGDLHKFELRANFPD